MRVCVVGAGAAGLCAARHLSAVRNVTKLMVFEQSKRIGGTWVYTDNIGKDQHGLPVHSSMYLNMKTNLPKEVMGFPDFPFFGSRTSFVRHDEVLRYLDQYCDAFSLGPFIQFEQQIASIRRIDSQNAWHVVSVDLNSNKAKEHLFDAIFICNGHYFVPKVPEIPGSSYFKGRFLHSHDYRKPESYAGDNVACLGAGPSGIDIALELSAHCGQVYLCHERLPLESPLPENVHQKPGFKQFTENGVILNSGEHITVGTVIYCTGYSYSFPFLDCAALPLHIADSRVTPLYQHMVHIEQPSLFFIGLTLTVCPFPHFDCQIRFAISVLTGDSKLPSKEKMYEWQAEDYGRRIEELKLKPNKAHWMSNMQWDYNRELARLGGFQCPVSKVVEKLYDHVHDYRKNNLASYKSLAFELVDSENFRCL